MATFREGRLFFGSVLSRHDVFVVMVGLFALFKGFDVFLYTFWFDCFTYFALTRDPCRNKCGKVYFCQRVPKVNSKDRTNWLGV